ncbi:hypothetical protein ACT3CE_12695 [Marinifilum sp. RC60d5]|uniref:hypothetical protein n=1 Tax=Marinifilum sp. RC60d5 TaxID=3458414 RepID=UPI004036C0EA
MKNLDSKLFEKNQIKKEELTHVYGGGCSTPAGPAYNGDVRFKDFVYDNGKIEYTRVS